MEEKHKFLEFSESLKLVRKTRIEDFIGDKNIDDIYTDLLPKNGIINKLNLPRTTILVGRKGTGKSTIFQKSQKDLVENRKCISIYIDVKSLFDNSTPVIPSDAEHLGKEFHKYLLYSNLVKEIILETKVRLDAFVQGSILQKILGFDREQIDRINFELSEIGTSITDVIKSVDLSLITTFKQINEENAGSEKKGGVTVSTSPSITGKISATQSKTVKTEFESTLVNYLDIKKCLINNLIRIKGILQVDHLYIFLDDYSEIDEEAQRIFMDWFIAPLNNLSDDFVKFKIAVYPHRFYYGKLDNAKIDEISLDFFDAFYSFEKNVNISKMETLALDYTKRLLTKRFNLFFPNNHWIGFFELSEKELFDLLFSVSFNIPRKIGYILSYCYESCLIHDTKITKEAIENASQRYYTDVILKYFLANQFVSRPFLDKISNEHQFELLNKIVERQKTNASSIYKIRMKGKPSNHFTVNKNVASLLDNLELNGFITTYNNVFDNNSELSIFYSLDLGLCKRHGLNFSRAYNSKLLNYFSHSRFNMNILIADYFNKTQLIRCSYGHEFPYEMKEVLERYKMKCPECLESGIISICEITISSIEIKEKLKQLETSQYKNFSYYEFQILDYLKAAEKIVSIDKISNALDKSTATINFAINKLVEKGFVKVDPIASKSLRKDVYYITEKGDKFITQVLIMIDEIIAKKRTVDNNN